MAVRPILLYPNPILKTDCRAVVPGDPALKEIIQDLLDTLDTSPGVALAAPQLGHAIRIIVVDVSRKAGMTGHRRLLLNPQILHLEGPRLVREGCLSVPDYTGNVRRYERTIVEGTALTGERITVAASGFEALAFQHELDHLDGRLFLDRIESLSTDLFRRKRY